MAQLTEVCKVEVHPDTVDLSELDHRELSDSRTISIMAWSLELSEVWAEHSRGYGQWTC